MTVYALLWTIDYEGSSLLGVYASREAAQSAWEVWRDGLVTVSDDECEIRAMVIGAEAESSWIN
jgi:hypothetical protein